MDGEWQGFGLYDLKKEEKISFMYLGSRGNEILTAWFEEFRQVPMMETRFFQHFEIPDVPHITRKCVKIIRRSDGKSFCGKFFGSESLYH